jgi:hypothetical protein
MKTIAKPQGIVPLSTIRLSYLVIILLATSFLVKPSNATAQVVLTPHPMAGFQFASKDVLNFDALYSLNQPVKVRYTASLYNSRGKMVVQYQSDIHVLQPGINRYNPTTFKVKHSRYFDRTIANVERSTSFLPSGDYTYCIQLYCADNPAVCEETIRAEIDIEACNDVRAEPISPLLLSFPEDEAELDNKRPNFSWIPPLPIGNDPNIRYTLSLVKMLEGQTAEDAIRRNRALYTRSGIQGITLMFPNQLNDLVEGEHYAWQVSAQIGETHIATSDVWEFEINKKEHLHYSVVLDEQRSNNIYKYNPGDTVFFVFRNPYSADDLSVSIHSTSSKPDTEDLLIRDQDEESHETYNPIQVIQNGKQMYAIPLTHLGAQSLDLYTISIKTRDKKQYQIIAYIK